MRETRHLWIGNLPDNSREERIAEHFKRYGKIDKVRLLPKRNSEHGLSACVAFVDIRSAQKANAVTNVIGEKELVTDYFDPSTRGGMSSNLPPQTSRATDEGQRHGQQVTTPSHRSSGQAHRRYDPHREGGSEEKSGYGEKYNRERQTTYDKHYHQPDGEEVRGESYDSDRSKSRGEEKEKSRGSSVAKHTSKKHKSESALNKSSKKKSKKNSEEAKTKDGATKKGKVKRAKERGRSPTLKQKKPLSAHNSTGTSVSPSGSYAASGKRNVKSAASSSEGRSSSTGSGSMSTSGSGRTSSNSSTASSTSTNSSRTHSSNSSSSESSYEPEDGPSHKKLVAMCIKKLPARPTVTSLRDGIFHEFKKYGKVKSVLVKGDGADRHALVLFRTAEEANKAVSHAKSKLLFGAAIEATIYEGEVSGQELEECGGIIDEFHPRASRTLFVGNLDKTVGYSDIQNIFVRFGEIVAIEIKKQHNIPQYAFLQYTDIASVVRAITKMDGEKLGRNTLKLGFGKTVMSSCLWVDGVTDSFTENYLASCFQRYGPVKHVVIDRNRGQALVFYSQYDYAQTAMAKMRARKLNGSRLKMDYASNELIDIFLKHMQNSGQSVQGLENIRQLLQPPSSPTSSTPTASALPANLPSAPSSQHYSRSGLSQEIRPFYDDHPPPPTYTDVPSTPYPPSSDPNYRRAWSGRSRERYPYPPEQSSHSRHGKRIYDDAYDRSEYHRDHSPPAWEHDSYPERRSVQPPHYDQDYRQKEYDIRRDQRGYTRKSSGAPYEEYHYRGSRERPRDPERGRELDRGRERDRLGEGFPHYPRTQVSPSHSRYLTRRSRSLSPHSTNSSTRVRDPDQSSIERVNVETVGYRRRGRSGSRSPQPAIDLLRNRKNSVESKSSSHSSSRYTSRTGDVDMRENISPVIHPDDKSSQVDERIVEFRKKPSKTRVRSKVVADSPAMEEEESTPKRRHHPGYKSSDAGSDREAVSRKERETSQEIDQQTWESPDFKDSYSENRSRSETPTRDENQDLIGEVIIKQPSGKSTRSESSRPREEKKFHHELERKESSGKPRDKDYRKGFTPELTEDYKPDTRTREERSSSSKGSRSRSNSSSLIQRVHSPDLERKSSLTYSKDFDYRKHQVVRPSKSRESSQKELLKTTKKSSRQEDPQTSERSRRRQIQGHTRIAMEIDEKKSNSSQSPLSPEPAAARPRTHGSAKLIKREYSPSPNEEPNLLKTRRESSDRSRTESGRPHSNKDRDFLVESPKGKDRDDRYRQSRMPRGAPVEDMDDRRSQPLKRRHSNDLQNDEEGSPEVSVKRERKSSISDGHHVKSKAPHHHPSVKHEAPMSIARQMFMQEEDESGADSPRDSRIQNQDAGNMLVVSQEVVAQEDDILASNTEQIEISEEALIVKKRKSRWENVEEDVQDDPKVKTEEDSQVHEFPNVSLSAAKSLLPRRLSKNSTQSPDVQEITQAQERIKKDPKENKGNLNELEREKMRIQQLLMKLDSEKLDVKDAEEVADVVLQELTSKAKSKILASHPPKPSPSQSALEKPLDASMDEQHPVKSEDIPKPDEEHDILLEETMVEEEIVVDTIEEVTEDEVIETEVEEETVVTENPTQEVEIENVVEPPTAPTEPIPDPAPVIPVPEVKKVEEIDSTQGYRKQMEAKKREKDKIEKRREHERKKLLKKQEKEKKRQMKKVLAMRGPSQSVISSVDDEDVALLEEDEQDPENPDQEDEGKLQEVEGGHSDAPASEYAEAKELESLENPDVEKKMDVEEIVKKDCSPLPSTVKEEGMDELNKIDEDPEQDFSQGERVTRHDDPESYKLQNLDLEKPWPPDKSASTDVDPNELKSEESSQGISDIKDPVDVKQEVVQTEEKVKEAPLEIACNTVESERIMDLEKMDQNQDTKPIERVNNLNNTDKPSSTSQSPITPSSTDQKTPIAETTPHGNGKEPSPRSICNSQSLTPSGSMSSSLSHKSSRTTPVTTPSQTTKTPSFTTPSPASTSSTSSSKSQPKQQKHSKSTPQGHPSNHHPQSAHHSQAKRTTHPSKQDRHSRSRSGHGSSGDPKRRPSHHPHHWGSSSSHHNYKVKQERHKVASIPSISRWPMASITIGLDTSPSKPLGKSELERLKMELESVKSQLSLEMSPSSLSPCSGDEDGGKSPAQLLSPVSPILRSPADSMNMKKVETSVTFMPGTSPGNTPSLTDRLKLLGKVKKRTPGSGVVVKTGGEKIQNESQKKDLEFRQSRIFRSSIFDQDSERLSHIQRQLELENKLLEDQQKGVPFAGSGLLFSGSKFLEQTPIVPDINIISNPPNLVNNVPAVNQCQPTALCAPPDTPVLAGAAHQLSQSSITGPKNVHSLSSCELPASAERKAYNDAGKECNINTNEQQVNNGLADIVTTPQQTPSTNLSTPPEKESNQQSDYSSTKSETTVPQMPPNTAIAPEDVSLNEVDNMSEKQEPNASKSLPQILNSSVIESTEENASTIELSGSTQDVQILPEEDATAENTLEEKTIEDENVIHEEDIVQDSQEVLQITEEHPKDASSSSILDPAHEMVTEEIVSDVPALTSNIEDVGQSQDSYLADEMVIAGDMDIYADNCMEIVETSVENEVWGSSVDVVTETSADPVDPGFNGEAQSIAEAKLERSEKSHPGTEIKLIENHLDDPEAVTKEANSSVGNIEKEVVKDTVSKIETLPPATDVTKSENNQSKPADESKIEVDKKQDDKVHPANTSNINPAPEKARKPKEESKIEKKKPKMMEKSKKRMEKRDSSKDFQKSESYVKQDADAHPPKKSKTVSSSKDASVKISSNPEKIKESVKSGSTNKVSSSTAKLSSGPNDKRTKLNPKTEVAESTGSKESPPVVKSKSGSGTSSGKTKIIKSHSGKHSQTSSKTESKHPSQKEEINIEQDKKNMTLKTSGSIQEESQTQNMSGSKMNKDAKDKKHPGENKESKSSGDSSKVNLSSGYKIPKKEDVSSKERKIEKHPKKDKKSKSQKPSDESRTSGLKTDQKKTKTSSQVDKSGKEERKSQKENTEKTSKNPNVDKNEQDSTVKTVEQETSQNPSSSKEIHKDSKDQSAASQVKDTDKEQTGVNPLKRKKKKKKHTVDKDASSSTGKQLDAKSEKLPAVSSKTSSSTLQEPEKRDKEQSKVDKWKKSSAPGKHKSSSSDLKKSSSEITAKSSMSVKPDTSKKSTIEKKSHSLSKIEKVKKHVNLKSSHSFPSEALNKEKDKSVMKQKFDASHMKKKASKTSSSIQSRYSMIYSSSSDSESCSSSASKSKSIKKPISDEESPEVVKTEHQKQDEDVENKTSKWPELDDGADSQRRHHSSSSSQSSSSSSLSDFTGPPPVVSSSLLVTETIKSETILPPGYDEDRYPSSFYSMEEEKPTSSKSKSKERQDVESKTSSKKKSKFGTNTPRSSQKNVKHRDVTKHGGRRLIVSSSSDDSSDNELVISMSSTSSSSESNDEEKSTSVWSKFGTKSGKHGGKKTPPTTKETEKYPPTDSDSDEDEAPVFPKTSASKPKNVGRRTTPPVKESRKFNPSSSDSDEDQTQSFTKTTKTKDLGKRITPKESKKVHPDTDSDEDKDSHVTKISSAKVKDGKKLTSMAKESKKIHLDDSDSEEDEKVPALAKMTTSKHKNDGPKISTSNESSKKSHVSDVESEEEKVPTQPKDSSTKVKSGHSELKKPHGSKTPFKHHDSTKTKKSVHVSKSNLDKPESKMNPSKTHEKKEKHKSKSSSLERSFVNPGGESEHAKKEGKQQSGGDKLSEKKKSSVVEKSKLPTKISSTKDKIKSEKPTPADDHKDSGSKSEKLSQSHPKKDQSHKHKHISSKSTLNPSSKPSTSEHKSSKDAAKPGEASVDSSKQLEAKKSSSKLKDGKTVTKSSSPSSGIKKDSNVKEKLKTDVKHHSSSKQGSLVHSKKKKMKKMKSSKPTEKISANPQQDKVPDPTPVSKSEVESVKSDRDDHQKKQEKIKALAHSLFSSDSEEEGENLPPAVKDEVEKHPMQSFPTTGDFGGVQIEPLPVDQHEAPPKTSKSKNPSNEKDSTPDKDSEIVKMKKSKHNIHSHKHKVLKQKHQPYPLPTTRVDEKRRGSAESFLTTSTTDDSDAEQRVRLQTVISSLDKDDDITSSTNVETVVKEEPGKLEIMEEFPSELESSNVESFVEFPTIQENPEKKEIQEEMKSKKITSPKKSPTKHHEKKTGKTKSSEKHKKMEEGGSRKKHKPEEDPGKTAQPGYHTLEHPGRYSEKKRWERMDRIKTHSHERDEEAVRSIVGIMDESSDADSYFSDVKSETEASHRPSSLGGLTPETGRTKRLSRDSDISTGSSNITKASASRSTVVETCIKLEPEDKSMEKTLEEQQKEADARTAAEENELAAAVSSIEGLFGDFNQSKSPSLEDLSSSSHQNPTSYLEEEPQDIATDTLVQEEQKPEIHREMSQEELERGSNEAALAASALLLEEESTHEEESYFGYQSSTERYSTGSNIQEHPKQENKERISKPAQNLQAADNAPGLASGNAPGPEPFSFKPQKQDAVEIELPSIRTEASSMQQMEVPPSSALNVPQSLSTTSASKKRQRSSRGGASSSGRSSSRESKSDWSVSDTSMSESELLHEPGKTGRRKGKGAKQRKLDKPLTSPNVSSTPRNDSYDFDSNLNTQTLSLPKPDGAGETMPFVSTSASPTMLLQRPSLNVLETSVPISTTSYPTSIISTSAVTAPTITTSNPLTGPTMSKPPVPVRQARKTSWDTDVFSPATIGAKRRSSSSSSSAHSPSRGSQFSQLTPPSSVHTAPPSLPISGMHMSSHAPSFSQAGPFVPQTNVSVYKTDTHATPSQAFPMPRAPVYPQGIYPQSQQAPTTGAHLSPKALQPASLPSHGFPIPRTNAPYTSIYPTMTPQSGEAPHPQIRNKTPPHISRPPPQVLENPSSAPKPVPSSPNYSAPRMQHFSTPPHGQPTYLSRPAGPQIRAPGGSYTNLTSMPSFPSTIGSNLSNVGSTKPAGMQPNTSILVSKDSIPASVSSFPPPAASLTSPPLHQHQFAYTHHPPGSQAPVQMQPTTTQLSHHHHHHIGVPTYPHHQPTLTQALVRPPTQSPQRSVNSQEQLGTQVLVRPEANMLGGPRSLPRPSFTQHQVPGPQKLYQPHMYQLQRQPISQPFPTQAHPNPTLTSPSGHSTRPVLPHQQISPGVQYQGLPSTPQQQEKHQLVHRTPSNPYLHQQSNVIQAPQMQQSRPAAPTQTTPAVTQPMQHPQQRKQEKSEPKQSPSAMPSSTSMPQAMHIPHLVQASPQAGSLNPVYGTSQPQPGMPGVRPRQVFTPHLYYPAQAMMHPMPGAFTQGFPQGLPFPGHPMMGSFLPGQAGLQRLPPTSQQLEEMSRQARMQVPALKMAGDKGQPQNIAPPNPQATVRTPARREQKTPTPSNRGPPNTSPMSQYGAHPEPSPPANMQMHSQLAPHPGHFRHPVASPSGHPYRPPHGDRVVRSQTDLSQEDMVEQHFRLSGVSVPHSPRLHSPVMTSSVSNTSTMQSVPTQQEKPKYSIASQPPSHKGPEPPHQHVASPRPPTPSQETMNLRGPYPGLHANPMLSQNPQQSFPHGVPIAHVYPMQGVPRYPMDAHMWPRAGGNFRPPSVTMPTTQPHPNPHANAPPPQVTPPSLPQTRLHTPQLPYPSPTAAPQDSEQQVLDLFERYPVIWQGLLALKNDSAAVQAHYICGDMGLANACFPKPDTQQSVTDKESNLTVLRIVQRMRLEPPQLEGVDKRMTDDSDFCLLLALPCGRDKTDVIRQQSALKQGFIDYLQQKQAAGIVNILGPQSEVQYVLHVFPPCDFTNKHLQRRARDLLSNINDIQHIMIVIAAV